MLSSFDVCIPVPLKYFNAFSLFPLISFSCSSSFLQAAAPAAAAAAVAVAAGS